MNDADALALVACHRKPKQARGAQVTETNVATIAEWIGGTYHRHTRTTNASVTVPTGDGIRPVATAVPGMWVVREVDGYAVQTTVVSDSEYRSTYVSDIDQVGWEAGAAEHDGVATDGTATTTAPRIRGGPDRVAHIDD